MTAQILQEELVKEIGVIFRDDLFKDSAGEYIKMNVYEQNLPIRQDEDAPDPIPYVIVRVETGQVKGGVEPQEVFVTLLIGYYFFGAASMTFATAAIRKEDRFA